MNLMKMTKKMNSKETHMVEINSYADAVRVMNTARNKSEGKPLRSYGFRMFLEGNEFIIKHGSKNYGWNPIARILPDDTLVLEFLSPAHNVDLSLVYNIFKILPVLLTNVGKQKYRVHIRPVGIPAGGSPASYAYESYADFRKKGYELHNGLTIDLKTRTVTNYSPKKVEVNAAARKVWLREVGALKRYLKTVAKLGGFTSLIANMSANEIERWKIERPFAIRGSECPDLQLIAAALKGQSYQELVNRFAELMYAHNISQVGEQVPFIDRIISNNSLLIRTHIGVVTYK
jgi:hypothetical protein